MPLSKNILKKRRLETLVENQTSYALKNAEMHIFETHTIAKEVLLKFDEPVLAYMLEGKKVMHLKDQIAFNFLPGESIILPSNELMCIDFPEAGMSNPTRCLAMAISEEKIRDTIVYLNENYPKIDDEWRFTDYNFHFTNDLAIQQIICRLLYLFTENHTSKDLFADFMLKELVVRILQTETKKSYSDRALTLGSSHRLAYILHYIRENLAQNLTIKELSNKIYMSESNFHRVFKSELNISPIDFINEERIKLATSLLQDSRRKIKDIYMECGFNSLSYFNRMFKRKKQISPKEYQFKINQQKMT